MNESLYQMYKGTRDLILFVESRPLSGDFCSLFNDYVRESKINCERYDRSNPDCLNRWLKEKQSG